MRANAILREFGIEQPNEIDLEAISQAYGATIVYERLTGCEARIIGHGDRAIITVNDSARPARRRFSGAHELGHWMRDRGHVAFGCTPRDFVSEWGADNPEQRANRFAADLLLPEFMFRPMAKNRPVTFDTVDSLAADFSTSITSTAIRLVELGSYPAMIVCNGATGRRWFSRGSDVPSSVWPREKPTSDSIAYDLLTGSAGAGAGEVSLAAWIDSEGADRFVIHEDSRKVRDFVVSLLWWKDETYLIGLSEDTED